MSCVFNKRQGGAQLIWTAVTKKGMFFNGVFIAAFLLGLNLLEGLFYRVAETYPSPFFDWLRDQLQSGDYGYSEGPLILLILPVIVVCVGVWVVCAGVASLLRKLRR